MTGANEPTMSEDLCDCGATIWQGPDLVAYDDETGRIVHECPHEPDEETSP